MSRTCVICESGIFNFQSLLKCTGGFCGKMIHLHCTERFSVSALLDRGIEVKSDENSKHGLVYRCSDCINLDSIHETSIDNIPNAEDDNKTTNNIHLAEILALVKTLYSEVKILRSDNMELKREIRELKNAFPSNLSPAINSVNHISENNSEAKHLPKNAKMKKQNESIPSHDVNVNNSGDKDLGVPSTSAQSVSPIELNESDNFIPVVHRRRKPRALPPLQGSLKSDALKVANRRSTNKELFVSRLDPSTSTQDLENFILNTLNLKFVKCTKLKARYESYSSFHLLINSEDFNKVHHEDVWPAGILIKPFLGKLNTSEAKNGAHPTS